MTDQPDPRVTVYYSHTDILLAWTNQSGHTEAFAMSPEAAQNVAHDLLRAVEDHTAHRKLIADIDGSFPDGDPQP